MKGSGQWPFKAFFYYLIYFIRHRTPPEKHKFMPDQEIRATLQDTGQYKLLQEKWRLTSDTEKPGQWAVEATICNLINSIRHRTPPTKPTFTTDKGARVVVL